jgi:uncharacterized protein (TIGR00251 family)
MTASSLYVHVQPRSGKTEVVGWYGDAVKIRLKAAPVGGAANEELVKFLAKVIGVPRSTVHIKSGATSRRKRIGVNGVSQDKLLAALGM